MKKSATPARSHATILQQMCQLIPSHLVNKLAKKW